MSPTTLARRTLEPIAARHSRVWATIDGGLRAVYRGCGLLVLPLALLLFLQWPLREWLGAWSREANDLAQVLFALYVAVAVSAATRAGSHLAADALARRYSPRIRLALVRIASLAILIPWGAFVLIVIAPAAWQSLVQLERFPETFNPGYFAIKLAVVLLALLVIVQAVVDVWPRGAPDREC